MQMLLKGEPEVLRGVLRWQRRACSGRWFFETDVSRQERLTFSSTRADHFVTLGRPREFNPWREEQKVTSGRPPRCPDASRE